MAKIYRVFTLFKRSGRREWRARRWDDRADHAGERAAFHSSQTYCLSVMGRKDLAEGAALDYEVAHMQMENSRRMAAAIRAGK